MTEEDIMAEVMVGADIMAKDTIIMNITMIMDMQEDGS
jgi:hypothetical protein